ncbi:MAG: biotin--[Clostridia bacterium]|nr:biotin--[acetyl-CoA-carboxylase] ligase [Clostridia bacterium]
ELYRETNIIVPPDFSLTVVAQTDSTNTHLLRLAKEGAPNGQVLLSRTQSTGKGSRGRSFFSPEGGIYLSLLLRNVPADRLPLLTPMAAVATYQALRPHVTETLDIKWVNDLYLAGKKVCGILCETAFLGEESATVIGIGINLLPPQGGFPDGFLHPATALFSAPDPAATEQMISSLLHRLYQFYQTRDFMQEYKAHCCTLGKSVTLRRGEEIVTGRAADLSPMGGLILELPDGSRAEFTSGEVTSQIEE